MPDLNPNAYAILGLLAARPWSAYELARHMKTSSNLRQIWPRAESKIYQAPKDLEAAGCVTSRKEKNGGRVRTLYRITAKGRRTLRAWLDEPAVAPRFELESALKVAYATAGSVEQLKEMLRVDREQRLQLAREIAHNAEFLREDGFAIPERAHTSALVASLSARIMRAIDDWNEWAQQTVAGWEEIEIDDEKRAWAESVYEELFSDLNRRIQNAPASDGSPRSSE